MPPKKPPTKKKTKGGPGPAPAGKSGIQMKHKVEEHMKSVVTKFFFPKEAKKAYTKIKETPGSENSYNA